VACSQSYVALAVVVVRGLTALSFEGVFLGTDDMQGLRLRQKQNERPQLQGLQLIITVQSSLQESNLDLGLCKGNYDNCSIQIIGKSATDRHNKRGNYQIISG